MAKIALSPNAEDAVAAYISDLKAVPAFSASLNSLEQQIMADNPHDVPVVLSNVQMDDDAFIVHAGQIYKYTTHSLYQLTNRIKPAKTIGVGGYFAACPPELRAVNFNYWHTERFAAMPPATPKNNAVLRMRNDGDVPLIRGVVSKTYIIVDDLPTLRILESIIPGGAVMRTAHGDLKSRYDIIWPSNKEAHTVNDTISVAVRLTNSEAGMSSIRIEPSVYSTRYRSSIFMPCRGNEFVIRHVGEAKLKLGAAFARAMKEISPFILNLNKARGDEVAKVTTDIDMLFIAIGKMFDLSADKVMAAKAMFHTINDPSRAGVAMALSAAANSYDIVNAEDMQFAAGKLIASGWNHIERMFDLEEEENDE